MKRTGYFALVAVAPIVAWCADISADPAFDRYRSIIDRMPFGEPPPGFDPTLAPGSAAAAAAVAAAAEGGMTEEQRTEEEQKLASSVRVSVLNVTPAGRTMVGFTDSSAKPPEHYYLPVGGERDGWSVKAADPATEKITLAKGEVEVTLKLGEGSTGDGKGGKKDAASPRAAPQPIRRGGLMGGRLAGGPMGGRAPQVASADGTATAAASSGALARLRERRARQAQEQQAEAARRAAAMAEEKAESERREAESERREAEAKAAAEQAAAEREQQRAALQQIQEELRRQREERQRSEQQGQEDESE